MGENNTEDKTRGLPEASSFEERVFARFNAVEATLNAVVERLAALEGMSATLNAVAERLTTLEEKVDARLKETRPIWEGVQADVRRLNSKFDQMLADFFETRTNLTALDRRVIQLEDERRSN